MAITLEELVTKWSLKFDGKAFQTLQEQVGKLKDTLATVGTGFAAASAAVLATAKFTSDAGAEFAKVAGMTGIATDRVQELAYAFQAMAGIDLGQASDLLTSFSRRLTEAMKTGEGEAAEGLKQLNFNIDRLKNSSGKLKDPIDALYQISDAIANLPASEQLLATDQLFEGESEAVVNVLRKGSAAIREYQKEARDLGLILDSGAIKKSVEFKLATQRLMAVLTGLRNTVGVELLPVLSEMIDGTIDWIKENKELVSSSLIAFSKDMILVIGMVAKGFVAATSALAWFIDAAGGVDKTMRVLNITLAGFAIAGAIYLASIAAIPLAIGAAIMLASVLIEDLWTFLEGGDSIIGDIVHAIEDWYNSLGPFQQILVDILTFVPRNLGVILSILGMIPEAVTYVSETFQEWLNKARFFILDLQDSIYGIKDSFVETFKEVTDIVSNFLKYMLENFTLENMLGRLASGIDSILPDIFSDNVPEVIGGMSMTEGGTSPMAYAAGITPKTAPTLQSLRTVQNNQTYQLSFSPQLPPLPQGVSKQEALRNLEKSMSQKWDDFGQYIRNQAPDNEDMVEK